MKNFYFRDWTMPEKVLLTAGSILLGIVIGFMAAPIKKGIYCGNNSGNTQLPEVKD